MFALQSAGTSRRATAPSPGLDPASERARMFVALEDWLADGVPLAAPVARRVHRRLVRREHARDRRSGGSAARSWTRPRAAPALVALPDRDRIVPPESARPLAG